MENGHVLGKWQDNATRANIKCGRLNGRITNGGQISKQKWNLGATSHSINLWCRCSPECGEALQAWLGISNTMLVWTGGSGKEPWVLRLAWAETQKRTKKAAFASVKLWNVLRQLLLQWNLRSKWDSLQKLECSWQHKFIGVPPCKPPNKFSDYMKPELSITKLENGIMSCLKVFFNIFNNNYEGYHKHLLTCWYHTSDCKTTLGAEAGRTLNTSKCEITLRHTSI